MAYNQLPVGRFLDGETGALVAALVAAVKGYQVVATAAADADFDCCPVVYDYRAGIEAVGGDGGECEDSGIGGDDWASNAQGVAC